MEEVVVHVQSVDRIVVHLRSRIRISLPWNVNLVAVECKASQQAGESKGFLR